jgi:NAD(P)-dependent dehydrogenase (short-subunit alcohol dehydrogenase family)
MKVFLADIDAEHLDTARKQVEAVSAGEEVESMVVDVSKLEDVVALRDKVMELWGEVAILMNNVSP